MDSVEKERLIMALGELGYPLISQVAVSADDVLSKLVQSTDERFLEGFPIVLTNLLGRDSARTATALAQVDKVLPSPKFKKRFRMLCAITAYLMRYWRGNDAADDGLAYLESFLKKGEPDVLSRMRNQMVHDQRIPIGDGVVLSPDRLRKAYSNYVVQSLGQRTQRETERLESKRDRALEEAMKILFAEKQREVLLKLLRNEPLSKTEKEYFSRVIKKRLRAISNPDIHSMADSLLSLE